MEYAALLKQRRTVRLFRQEAVADETLAALVDAARVASCASNKQRLRYIVVRTPELVLEVLKHTRWAGLVQPRRTPQPGVTSPAAFIVITTTESELSELLCADAGAAVQSMEFAACDAGLGCCWLGAIDREAIEALLGCEKIVYLAAVGYPAETPCSVDVAASDSVAYYIDENDTLTVPKIRLEDVMKWR
ncbi:MAG: nitroreductase family protein [Lentisphaeria bacterium]|nr:nitroreductase family protein [Lentisphaeria bacterium]